MANAPRPWDVPMDTDADAEIDADDARPSSHACSTVQHSRLPEPAPSATPDPTGSMHDIFKHIDRIVFPCDICAYDACIHHVDLQQLRDQYQAKLTACETDAERRKRLQTLARTRREELREYKRIFPDHDRLADTTNGLGFDPADRAPMPQSVPCVNCLGAVRYCSVECLIRHRSKHQKQCLKTLRSVQDRIFRQRMDQIKNTNRGYPGLLQHVLAHASRDDLVSHVFFTRLPFDTQTHITTNYPIRRVLYTQLVSVVRDNQCLLDTYRALLKEMKRARDNMIDQVYFIAYTPDMMITWLTAVPFEEATKLREIDISVTCYTTLCSCRLHKAAS